MKERFKNTINFVFWKKGEDAYSCWVGKNGKMMENGFSAHAASIKGKVGSNHLSQAFFDSKSTLLFLN